MATLLHDAVMNPAEGEHSSFKVKVTVFLAHRIWYRYLVAFVVQKRVGGDFAGATSGPTIFTRSALTPEVSHIGFHSCFQSHLPEHVSRRTLVRVLLRSC